MITHSDVVPTLGLAEENATLRTRLLSHEAGIVRDESVERLAISLFMMAENVNEVEVAFDLWDAMGRMQQRGYIVKAKKQHDAIIALRCAPLLMDENGDVKGFPGSKA